MLFVPIKGISAPPRAGPIIPEISSCSPLNTDAEGSSSSDTMSVSREENAGALKAKPAPIRNTKSSMRGPLRRCNQPRIARPTAEAANQMCVILTNFARSTCRLEHRCDPARTAFKVFIQSAARNRIRFSARSRAFASFWIHPKRALSSIRSVWCVLPKQVSSSMWTSGLIPPMPSNCRSSMRQTSSQPSTIGRGELTGTDAFWTRIWFRFGNAVEKGLVSATVRCRPLIQGQFWHRLKTHMEIVEVVH